MKTYNPSGMYEWKQQVLTSHDLDPRIGTVDRLLLEGMYERGMPAGQAVEELNAHYINTGWVTPVDVDDIKVLRGQNLELWLARRGDWIAYRLVGQSVGELIGTRLVSETDEATVCDVLLAPLGCKVERGQIVANH